MGLRRIIVLLIAVVAGGAAVYWLRGILTPLAMAIFLMIMIDGVKRSIEARTPVPSRWAGLTALLLVVLGFLASIAVITNGALNFFSEASGVTTRRTDGCAAATCARRSWSRPSTTTAGLLCASTYSTSGIASRKFSAVGIAPIFEAP